MIDTHTHLNFKAFEDDYANVIHRAKASGVEKMFVVGTSLNSSKKAVIISKKQSACFATIGIHPHHVSEFELVGKKRIREQLLTLLCAKRIVAIGETGLDYHQYKNYPPISNVQKKLQKELLFLHLEIAKMLNLPVIFHCREAMDDMLEVLVASFKRLNYSSRGVFHCFEGIKSQRDKVLALGLSVGFDGNITYPESSQLRNLIATTPLERILLETDSPYLTPEPLREKRNEPKNLALIASFIASIKRDSLENIIKNTTQNAHRLFLTI